jgi:molecular chaperone GrpE
LREAVESDRDRSLTKYFYFCKNSQVQGAMIDDIHPTESPQDLPEPMPVEEGLEELREDAVGEIDLEAAFGQDLEAAVATGDAAAEGSVQGTEAQETVANLERQMAALKAQLDDRTTQYVRIAADFDNYRKRISKEREDQEVQSKCATISELLPVIDNFERARAHIKPQTEAEMTIHKSYQSVYKQLVDCLKRLGVSVMRVEGQEFDPNLHEAVMRQPTSEYPEGTVMEELVRGYLVGERVLRHAMVKVAAPPEEAPPEQGTEGSEGTSD